MSSVSNHSPTRFRLRAKRSGETPLPSRGVTRALVRHVCGFETVSRTVAAACAALVWASAALNAAAAPLRVCADPNNMPFSNARMEGFENKIAQLIADDLKRPLTYFWWPQRRGFVRQTLNAGRCDVVIGVVAQDSSLQPTHPYYRSSYAFVSRRSRGLDIRAFDDPRLRTLTIGIQIVGEDYGNPPPAQALASRQLARNVRGYTVYGDYSKADPQREVIDAVANGEVDVAVVWGPLAGYFARDRRIALDVLPVAPTRDQAGLRFAFDIAMGVRRGDDDLRLKLDDVIARRRVEIRRILARFGVPLP